MPDLVIVSLVNQRTLSGLESINRIRLNLLKSKKELPLPSVSHLSNKTQSLLKKAHCSEVRIPFDRGRNVCHKQQYVIFYNLHIFKLSSAFLNCIQK